MAGGDVIIGANNPFLTVDGDGVLVKDGANITGGTVNFAGTGEIGDLSSTKITLGQNDSLTANGTADAFYGGGGDAVVLRGADMTAHVLAGDGLTDVGGGTITAAAGSSVYVSGAGDPATTVIANNLALGGSQTAANGEQLGILVGAGAAAIVSGTNDGAETGANALLTDNGANLTANLGPGTGATFNRGVRQIFVMSHEFVLPVGQFNVPSSI